MPQVPFFSSGFMAAGCPEFSIHPEYLPGMRTERIQIRFVHNFLKGIAAPRPEIWSRDGDGALQYLKYARAGGTGSARYGGKRHGSKHKEDQ